ncbi:SRPBCC family protein [Methylotenera sp.]|uniref:SRPBCC family protein n=1 Tax=Methylotenera sp. TaxID=2051956 RepID=UPI0027308E3A|nr:SRPBCC family protein [Methylotenera sp.]MDP2229537.1 SRPBCC family protein [Methylotenera sp.]MDP3005975.1 SRPBCC family protein [Methylotenera sp.]MDP3140919.1 SRPBCC family protein [Methylotenera sp.]MDZ4211802.1 SRPBCC family protein [Methylotenera sp.]
MKKILAMIAVACLLPVVANAHGPSGQKVVKEFEVKAEPAKVWALLKDFGAIGKWHPDVTNVKLENRKDEESGKELPHRLVTLKNGTTFLEKLREANDADMKLDYKLVDGKDSTIAVSNYRTVAQVKSGKSAGQSIVTLTARFYNKANTMEAPAGADNPAANKAINELYDAAAAGLQKAFEK